MGTGSGWRRGVEPLELGHSQLPLRAYLHAATGHGALAAPRPGRDGRIRTCDLVFPKHAHWPGYATSRGGAPLRPVLLAPTRANARARRRRGGASSWDRTNLTRASTERFHQISFRGLRRREAWRRAPRLRSCRVVKEHASWSRGIADPEVGFEPTFAGPEPAVLPLDDSGAMGPLLVAQGPDLMSWCKRGSIALPTLPRDAEFHVVLLSRAHPSCTAIAAERRTKGADREAVVLAD